MADTCFICNTKISFIDSPFLVELENGEKKDIHYGCRNRYFKNPEEFGGLVKKGDLEILAAREESRALVAAVKLTTTPTYPNLEIEEVKGVITSECVFGMNVFKDFFAGMTDFFGGRSETSQKVLRDARETCLNELKKEAYELGADGVIGIDLDYSEISGKGKGMLFLVASGTAVKFKGESV